MRWTLAFLFVGACGFGSPPGSSGDDNGGDDGSGPDGAGGPGGTWWNQAWSARMRIVIDNAAPLPAGFQIGLPRDLDAAPCAGPRSAVRVVHDHTTELARVIDELD